MEKNKKKTKKNKKKQKKKKQQQTNKKTNRKKQTNDTPVTERTSSRRQQKSTIATAQHRFRASLLRGRPPSRVTTLVARAQQTQSGHGKHRVGQRRGRHHHRHGDVQRRVKNGHRRARRGRQHRASEPPQPALRQCQLSSTRAARSTITLLVGSTSVTVRLRLRQARKNRN